MTIEQYAPQSALTDQIQYAQAVSVATMLPDTYRGKPADIMLAVGLGQSMGLSPAESLYRIAVIKGKPTASAELIAANVRKAGHRLRVVTDETAKSVTASIVRADDPDFAFEVTRDMAWAQAMGLATNDNYRKQALTMLQWRAITAVARLACPEALYGVIYTPDEIADDAPAPAAPTAAADRMRAALGKTTAEQVPDSPPLRVEAQETTDSLPDVPASESVVSEAVTKAQLSKIGALMSALGITDRANALLYVSDTIGRDVQSRSDLSKNEASLLIDALEADAAPAVSE